MASQIGIEVHLAQPYEQAVESVITALKDEGFGVLTRIDVKATLKEKLGEDFRPYVILGACNPPLAHRALKANGEVGLMLPCNVTVEALPGGDSLVRLVNPEMMMTVGDLGNSTELRKVAAEAYKKLQRAALALQNG